MASPNVTTASLRKSATQAAATQAAATQASGPAAGSATANPTPTKYSHRQAKAYKPSELPQYTVPNFTIKDLLSAIPAHCFERSALHSFAYVFADLAMVAALAYAATFIDPLVSSVDFSRQSPLPASVLSAAAQQTAARWSLWGLYTFFQGCVFTGLWVIAHECGHQAFSTSKSLNNAVGWVLHSALLVPYHSWRISHARHHAATGHLTRDEVFVPRTRAQKGLLPLKRAEQQLQDDGSDVEAEEGQVLNAVAPAAKHESVTVAPEYQNEHEKESFGEWLAEVLEDAPAYNLVMLVLQQLFGWPMYLIKNTSGQLHYPKGTNHFQPESVIFDARHRMQIIASDIGLAITLSALCVWGTHLSPNGFVDVARYYLVPYLWCNHWLVMITCLQHTDVALPHYQASEWTFPRGALCTIDRSWLWPIGPYLLHGIAETHVCHHISSKIPHYHAWEATEALKQRLGEHYKATTENVFVSLWRNSRACKFVDENDKIAFYRNAHGVPSAIVKNRKADENSDSGLALSD
ncbi:hypothetical protein K437DRAFT_296667 [Tilletiaria anomala UBC 951]|uniref:Fatty acid desaturase domain-containing protein n=1 Tax=Tilletiaria anomala (strain ATCC 24038 / CBS 436.72 / UBC 951) TaxID=1037660 RepID=A0A066V9Z7_TILAU|nr:uncharacterized protein K437DRAFT_296667 [Tilletiaria anomala UBC 951]KDN37123.1 hypothetical protein K437DRAFT_296667 [Tilletiaria anomala UBC 951]